MGAETNGYSPETEGQIGKNFEMGRVTEIQDGRTRLETELRKDGAVMAMLLYLGKDRDQGRVSLAEITGLLGPRWSLDEVRKILEDNNFKTVSKYEEEETYKRVYKQIVAIEKEIESLSKRQSQKKIRKTKELNKLKKRLKKFSLEAAGISELSKPIITGELEVYRYDAALIGKWQAQIKRDDEQLIGLVREHIHETSARLGGFNLNLGGPVTTEALEEMEPVEAVVEPEAGKGDDQEDFWK